MNRLLDHILEPHALRTFFQPIVELGPAGRVLCAVEALTRGPEGTNAADACVLFDYVRRMREEPLVDRLCVATAVAHAARLPAQVRLHVNVHASSLSRPPDFPKFLRSVADVAAFDLRRLTLEIVSHGALHDVGRLQRTLGELRQNGVLVSVDDVGGSASDLRTIFACSPDFLGLDRSLVASARGSDRYPGLLAALALAQSLGAVPIAEGVETPEDVERLAALGVRHLQGYLVGEPVLARAFDPAAYPPQDTPPGFAA